MMFTDSAYRTFFEGSNFSFKSPGSSLSHAPLVGKGPGAIALDLILYLAHSKANERVKLKTPDLAHAEGTN